MSNSIKIGPIRATKTGKTHRVEALVDGTPLWFETDDASLSATPTAIGTALLPAAMYHGKTLEFSDPFCQAWYQRLPEAIDRLHQWWQFEKRLPQTSAEPKWLDPNSEPADGVGLFFTGGVDSFHSLLNAPVKISHLVYAIDYDVIPHSQQQLSGYEPWLREVAQRHDIDAIIIRGNLRRHPAFAGPSWQQSHGAALIGTGHLLEESFGELVMSSSYSLYHPQPWGSHWLLDSLWSSERLQVTHFGEECLRYDKVKSIVHDPLTQKYLRPCWENPVGKINCSVCEKCVRTQIVIAACTDLPEFTAFDSSEPLVKRIDRLRKIPHQGLIEVYEDFLNLELPLATIDAIDRLIKRSRGSVFRKRTRQRVRRWFSAGRPSNKV